MNLTELRDALDDLAGPLEAPSETERQAVRRRVRRSRLVRATSAAAVSVTLLVGAVAVVAANDDDRTPVVTGEGTTVHDDRFGFTVTIPPGWEQLPLEVDRANPLTSVMVLGFAYTPPSILSQEQRTRLEFDELAPIQVERRKLEQQLYALPPGSPGVGRIQGRIDALNDREVVIRSCAYNTDQEGIRISMREGEGVNEPRPTRFGPDSGTSFRSETRPICGRFFQTLQFRDGDRGFYVAITMAPDTSPALQAEAYSILNSLRFDPTTPSTGGTANEPTTTTTLTLRAVTDSCVEQYSTPTLTEYLGLTQEAAGRRAATDNLMLRTAGVDGVCALVTADRRDDRVNIDVFDDVVVDARLG